MKALVFRYSLSRLAVTRALATFSPSAFLGPWSSIKLEDIPVPPLPGDDWLVLRTVQCGICGSDAKQVFLKGHRDNPMTAVISFPQVLGHEAAGVIEEVGPAVRGRKVGERVVLNPWLSCGPRGIDPPCAACANGDYSICERFTEGRLSPGIHAGNCSDVPGGFAERIIAHESQVIPVPDGVSWDAAALADPFSVSLHSILLSPPPSDDASTLVFGCGTLGLLAIAILRMFYPKLFIFAVARYPHQVALAQQLGASEVLPEGHEAIVEAVARHAGQKLLRPWQGEPWLLRGVDVIYDTVGSPESVALGLRIASARGKLVVSGVEAPKRFEWTPLYFKEISVIGSNAFGVETFEGRRLHAMQIYFELLARGLDVTPIVTHHFPLRSYRDAFMTLRDKGKSGAVKAMFKFADTVGQGSA
ncbi:MAG: alcohol dehydrogenase catalytic domain-containing protein [Dehalococcoidia bacterium]